MMNRKSLEIAVLLYPGMTALDAVGPYEILRGLPGARFLFTAKERGLVTTDSDTLKLNADFALAEVPAADVLLIPGGATTREHLRDPEILDWVRRIHAGTRWTTSVCSGSLILAAAGLLDGLEASTHWQLRGELAAFGACSTDKRVVRQGKIVTAAGVSSGIDMALELVALECGETHAKAIQLAVEYDPQPPFDTGSLEKATPEVVEFATAMLSANARRAGGAQ